MNGTIVASSIVTSKTNFCLLFNTKCLFFYFIFCTLALTIDTDDALLLLVERREENRVARDAVAIDERAGADVKEVHVAELSEHVEDAVLLRNLSGDREVGGGLWREDEVGRLLLELRAGALLDLENVDLGSGGGAHGEREERRRLRRAFGNERRERARVTLDRLRHLALGRVELHVAGDAALLLRDADQAEPLQRVVGAVVDDLARREIGMSIKYLDGLAGAIGSPVENGVVRDERERRRVHPLPEHNRLGHRRLLHLSLLRKVIYL